MTFLKVSLSGLFVLFLVSCQKSTDVVYFQKSQSLEAKENYAEAITYLNKVIDVTEDRDLAIKAARRGVFLSKTFTKDYPAQIRFLRIIVLKETERTERESAQKEIAKIYYEKLTNYTQAIEEYYRILSLDLPVEEKIGIRLKIARSYYYLGQFKQALLEVERVDLDTKSPTRFDVDFLKGNIFTGLKNLKDAIRVYKSLIDSFPDRSKTEQVPLNLAVAYEESKDFDQAIEVLATVQTKTKKDKEFIDLKIQRLENIKKMQPGAKGYRK